MNEFDILKALGEADPALVESAAAPRAKKRSRLVPVLAASAAAIVLAVGIGFAVGGMVKKTNKIEAVLPTEEQEKKSEITETAVPKPTPSPEYSYIGFIKYNGTVYLYHDTCPDARELLGEYLGRIENTANPGTPLEEIPDMTSYEKGDFYAVKGFDPAYLICRVDGKEVSVFISHDTEGVTCGRDVLETRFHASLLFTSLVYEGTESVFNGYCERYALDPEYNSYVLDMLAALDEGEWIGPYTDENMDEWLAIMNSEQWRLSLSLGKLRIGITVFEGGYACVHQYPNTCLIRFDAEKIKPFWDLLAEGAHGTPVGSGDSTRALRPEQLYDEPNYGAYFPLDIPEGYRIEDVHIFFGTDERTGEVLLDKPEWLSAEYRGVDDFDSMFSINVRGLGSLDAFLEELRGIEPEYRCEAPIDELSAETVREGITDNGLIFREVMAYDGNILITVRSWSLTPEEMVELLHKCFGR